MSEFLNPDEVKKRKRIIVDNSEEIENLEEEKESKNKYYNRGGQACIKFETNGRFNTDSFMYFKDYTVEDVSNLSLSKPEDLLESLVTMLSNARNEDSTCEIENMLTEELLEVLFGITMEFSNVIHLHPWICECQLDLPQKQQQVNEAEIDLRTLKYISIEEADEKMKKHFKEEVLDNMTESEFREYVKELFENNPLIDTDVFTKEDLIKKIKVKEPIDVKALDGNIYSFNFIRVKDLINAQKIAEKEFSPKLKVIKNRRHNNINVAEFKVQQEKDIEKVKENEARAIILYAKALSMVEMNGKKLDENERIANYRILPRSVLIDLSKFMEKIQFGIHDEREFTCKICGETSRRLLQQEFTPYEFLPIDSNTKREQGKHGRLKVHFRI